MVPRLLAAAALVAAPFAAVTALAQEGGPSGGAAQAPQPSVPTEPAPPPPLVAPPASTPVVPPSPVGAPVPDHVHAQETAVAKDAGVKLRWRNTWLVWENLLLAQTLGVGKNYQSANPTYEMSGSLRPRYYIYDGGDEEIFAAGRIDLAHEFTNSDTTTERGETTFTDATLLTAYSRLIAGSRDGDYKTIFRASLPVLTLPTSKVSMDNGTYLGLGTAVRLKQVLPLAPHGPVFTSIALYGILEYNHTFTRTTTPTNDRLQRVRIEPEGRAVVTDQLAGAAFPEHELRVTGIAITEITDKLSLWLEGQYRPTWMYGFRDVAITTQTGSRNAEPSLTRNRYVPLTYFEAAVYYDIIDELSVGLGYINLETQPGLDGLRRSVFYSPGSQVYLSFIGHLDTIYLSARREKAAPNLGP